MRTLLFVLLALAVSHAAAQDDEDQADERLQSADFFETENCIRTRSIRRTKVIDDSTIAFYMRNRDLVYINSLPNRCPQLASNDRFSYESRGGRLCRSDRITVLLQFAGRLESGFSCRLGDFQRSDRESVDIMIDAIEQGGPAPVQGESVELPPEDETDEADAAED